MTDLTALGDQQNPWHTAAGTLTPVPLAAAELGSRISSRNWQANWMCSSHDDDGKKEQRVSWCVWPPALYLHRKYQHTVGPEREHGWALISEAGGQAVEEDVAVRISCCCDSPHTTLKRDRKQSGKGNHSSDPKTVSPVPRKEDNAGGLQIWGQPELYSKIKNQTGRWLSSSECFLLYQTWC